jgi:hypothetical protein
MINTVLPLSNQVSIQMHGAKVRLAQQVLVGLEVSKGFLKLLVVVVEVDQAICLNNCLGLLEVVLPVFLRIYGVKTWKLPSASALWKPVKELQEP